MCHGKKGLKTLVCRKGKDTGQTPNHSQICYWVQKKAPAKKDRQLYDVLRDADWKTFRKGPLAGVCWGQTKKAPAPHGRNWSVGAKREKRQTAQLLHHLNKKVWHTDKRDLCRWLLYSARKTKIRKEVIPKACQKNAS